MLAETPLSDGIDVLMDDGSVPGKCKSRANASFDIPPDSVNFILCGEDISIGYEELYHLTLEIMILVYRDDYLSIERALKTNFDCIVGTLNCCFDTNFNSSE